MWFSKLISGLALLITAPLASAKPHFGVISNISENTLFASHRKSDRQGSLLASIDLDTKKITGITPPPELIDKEVMALHVYKENLFLIAQRSFGDGLKPILLIFNLKQKKWKLSGEFNCSSFDTVHFAGKRVEMECEHLNPDSDEGYKTSLVPLVIAEDAGKKKIILPIQKAENQNYRAQLAGAAPQWNKIEISQKHAEGWKTKFWLLPHQL